MTKCASFVDELTLHKVLELYSESELHSGSRKRKQLKMDRKSPQMMHHLA